MLNPICLGDAAPHIFIVDHVKAEDPVVEKRSLLMPPFQCDVNGVAGNQSDGVRLLLLTDPAIATQALLLFVGEPGWAWDDDMPHQVHGVRLSHEILSPNDYVKHRGSS
jgi:hypothetical protein